MTDTHSRHATECADDLMAVRVSGQKTRILTLPPSSPTVAPVGPLLERLDSYHVLGGLALGSQVVVLGKLGFAA